MKTTKSGWTESAFTASIAFGSVPFASGFGGPSKPQWRVGELDEVEFVIRPAESRDPQRVDANTTPPPEAGELQEFPAARAS